MTPALLLQGCKCKAFTTRVKNRALMPHLQGADGVACNGVMVVMVVMVMVVALVLVTVKRSVELMQLPVIFGVRVAD